MSTQYRRNWQPKDTPLNHQLAQQIISQVTGGGFELTNFDQWNQAIRLLAGQNKIDAASAAVLLHPFYHRQQQFDGYLIPTNAEYNQGSSQLIGPQRYDGYYQGDDNTYESGVEAEGLEFGNGYDGSLRLHHRIGDNPQLDQQIQMLAQQGRLNEFDFPKETPLPDLPGYNIWRNWATSGYIPVSQDHRGRF